MVRWPWRTDSADGEAMTDANVLTDETDIVECPFQDGSVSVYKDRVQIKRPDRSRHDDKAIDINRITGVRYEKGITIGYLQIKEDGVEADTGGLLSDPIDANTLHFGRGDRDCARKVEKTVRKRL